MNICEAMEARTREMPFIARRIWGCILHPVDARPVYIQPTDSPEGCLFYGPSKKGPRRRWSPTAEDLTAKDWEPVEGY